MQKWLLSAVFSLVFGSVAVLAQGQPPRDERRPQSPPPPQQHMMQQQMMQHQMAMQRQHQVQVSQPRCPLAHHGPLLVLLVLGTAIIHILLAMWVYQDLRKRNTGSGIWIVITLLAGLCGAAVYALVRLGEKQA